MNIQPRVALVPFYLKLYDEVVPERRAGFDGFIRRIAAGLEMRGLAVTTTPVCRVAGEFRSVVPDLETRVDAIATLHLAYSPSLESVDVFHDSALPLILLDTTMDASFGPGTPADRIMYNHGVHGVMDFACMLRRRGRAFDIVAGHESDPRVLDRAAGWVRAAVAARELRGTHVLRIGPAFQGMGDFAVEPALLERRFGVSRHEIGLDALDRAILEVDESAVAAELTADRERFDCDLDENTHRDAVRVGLGLRRLLAAGRYGAMSVNFQAFDRPDRPACSMPFLEIAKAMARGTGYGGEGDVLTAALVGALARAFGAVTFTEIFCADWSGDALFLSHMGELSPAVIDGRPRVFEKPFPFSPARNPAVLTGPVQPGPAAFVNLAPGPEDAFTLIVVPVTVQPEDRLDPSMQNALRAWIRPRVPVADFLERFARVGGTHHSALVLGDVAEAVAAFGRHVGVTVTTLQ